LNNKGLGYIDWIISMSLFIVVVVMIFSFLRPGIEPNFESQDLIYIAESNFFQENTWTSISVPIAINTIINNSIKASFSQEQLGGWNYVGYYSSQEPIPNLQISLTPDKVEISCISNYPCQTETSPNGPSTQGIYLISMPNNGGILKSFKINNKCEPSVDLSACKYTIGAKEVFTGLKESNILNLSQNPSSYNQKKKDWNFPKTREFAISLDYINGSQPISVLTPDYSQPEQLSVFVKEISMQILEPNGTRKPAKINIRVW